MTVWHGSLNTDVAKIDGLATDGLDGVPNSIAYRLEEIEKHFHSGERWYGDDGDSTGSTANNLTAWTLTAGTAEAYGTEVLLLAANDVSDSDFSFVPVKFDMRVNITESSVNDKNYLIQIWSGTGTFGEATLATEFPYRTASNAGEAAPMTIQMNRQVVANKLWARCKCETNSGTVDVLLGVHAYKG